MGILVGEIPNVRKQDQSRLVFEYKVENRNILNNSAFSFVFHEDVVERIVGDF